MLSFSDNNDKEDDCRNKKKKDIFKVQYGLKR